MRSFVSVPFFALVFFFSLQANALEKSTRYLFLINGALPTEAEAEIKETTRLSYRQLVKAAVPAEVASAPLVKALSQKLGDRRFETIPFSYEIVTDENGRIAQIFLRTEQGETEIEAAVPAAPVPALAPARRPMNAPPEAAPRNALSDQTFLFVVNRPATEQEKGGDRKVLEGTHSQLMAAPRTRDPVRNEITERLKESIQTLNLSAKPYTVEWTADSSERLKSDVVLTYEGGIQTFRRDSAGAKTSPEIPFPEKPMVAGRAAAPEKAEPRRALEAAPTLLNASDYRVGELVADLSYTDREGRRRQLSQLKNPAVVIALFKEDCPLSQKYAPELSELIAQNPKAAFLIVSIGDKQAPEDLERIREKYRFTALIVADEDDRFQKALFAQSTTEAFVLDRARTLQFRGPISDQHGLGYSLPQARKAYLAKAIEQVVRGELPYPTAISSPGCRLNTKSEQEPLGEVTFHNRVSRIFQNHCEKCHRESQGTPFSLGPDFYQKARSNREMIRAVVENGTMPPWFSSDRRGVFENDCRLSGRDRAAIAAWVGAGSPEGDPVQAPLPRKWARGWKIGEPELVLTTPTIHVPARGTVPYQRVIVRNPSNEDRWIRAMETRPRNPDVVHHALAFLGSAGAFGGRADTSEFMSALKGYFAAYSPGHTAVVYTEGFGKRLPAHSEISVQIHYQPNGVAKDDQIDIGFIFWPDRPQNLVTSSSVFSTEMRIPPGEANYFITASKTIMERTRVLSFSPHMHIRGKAFQVQVQAPGEAKKTVLEIPKYDFNWQLEYKLARPLDLEPGTRMTVNAWYDNSDRKPGNPDPRAWVTFGENTWDEMLIGYYDSHPLTARE